MVWVFHTPPISQVLNCRTLFLFYGKFFHRFPSFPNPSSPSSLRPQTTESLHDKEDTKPRKVMASKEMLENLSPTNKHYESGIVPRVMRIYWLSSLGKKKISGSAESLPLSSFLFLLSSSERNLQRKGKTGISSSLWTLERKEKTASTWQSLGKQVCLWLPTIPSDPIPYYPKRMSNGCIFIASACIGG